MQPIDLPDWRKSRRAMRQTAEKFHRSTYPHSQKCQSCPLPLSPHRSQYVKITYIQALPHIANPSHPEPLVSTLCAKKIIEWMSSSTSGTDEGQSQVNIKNAPTRAACFASSGDKMKCEAGSVNYRFIGAHATHRIAHDAAAADQCDARIRGTRKRDAGESE